MDLRALLEPRDSEPPSGDNLEYDPVFTEMELAAQPGEERQIGDEVTAAEDPEYRDVKRTALDVLGRSHDLRAAIFLGDAVLRLDGIQAFADVTSYIRGCLENYWETCHPELDADDDDDPTMRINAIQGLCGQPGGLGGPSQIYASLRRAALTDSRNFGHVSLRDIEIAEGVIPLPSNMDSAPDTGTIGAAFKDSPDDFLSATLDAVRRAREDVKAINAVFDDKTPGRGPELDELIKLLGTMDRRLTAYGNVGDAADGDAPDDAGVTAAQASGGGVVSAPAIPGAINSPADVSAALDRIIGYYRRQEPSSPIPILLERAKRLVGADFLTIIRDMAPSGMDNVQTVGGLEDDDD
ncbi:MAG: type VI secretion system protein TssA [Rhodobacteraceae bacterium]|nr:type VI secretion system protein TssA [Paracoccaceae bacterium]QEW19744.1 type VI secretion-associated protein, ImpA family [Marinibacterium anthonyi]